MHVHVHHLCRHSGTVGVEGTDAPVGTVLERSGCYVMQSLCSLFVFPAFLLDLTHALLCGVRYVSKCCKRLPAELLIFLLLTLCSDGPANGISRADASLVVCDCCTYRLSLPQGGCRWIRSSVVLYLTRMSSQLYVGRLCRMRLVRSFGCSVPLLVFEVLCLSGQDHKQRSASE